MTLHTEVAVKLILKLVGALLALLIITAIAVPMFISADYLKEQLQAQVKKATGRELAIKGKASLSVFPTIAIQVEDVTLGNPDGFTSPYLVHIKKLETGAALRPLLAKELRVTGVTLDGATLYLEQAANGKKNWEFASSAASKPEQKSSPSSQFSIGDVLIRDTAVHYLKAGAKPALLEKITVTLSGADGRTPLSLTGGAVYRDQPAQLSLAVDRMDALLKGQGSNLRAQMNLPASVMTYQGKLALADGVKSDGTLTFSSDHLAKTMAWIQGGELNTALPKKVSVSTVATIKTANDIALEKLTFSADSLSGSGALAIALGGKVPAIRGNITIAKLDLAALSGAPSSSAASQKNAAPASSWSEKPIDASALRRVNATMKLAIGTFTNGKLELSDIAANLALKDGVMNLELANLSAYQGKASGVVTLNASGAALGLASRMDLRGVAIEPLMTALSGASRVEGTANLSFDITARGGNQLALMQSLGGSGNITIKDGAIKGINIASFLRDAKKGFILGESSTESTDFTELTASYRIAQGVLTNKDLAMKSPVLRLAGSGTVSLPPRTIDYKLVPTLVGTLKGQGGSDTASGLAIPLIITGPWSAISITPDLEGLVTNALKDPAALQKNIKDIGGTIKELNSPSDIGAALLGGKKAAAPAADGAAPAPAKKPKLEDAVGGFLGGIGN